MDKNKTQSLNSTKIVSDDEAVLMIRAGNTNAFEIIMRRYNQQLYRIARSILKNNHAAQDAVQQAYIAAYYKLDSYTSSTRFSAWLTRITINEALMMKRKPDNQIAEENTLNNELLSDTSTDSSTIHANNELATLIESAVEKLPEDFRYVFVLRSIQELSTKETAECLNINEATVKTRLFRARNLMQHTLSEHIEKSGMQVFEFAGKRCDNIVKTVLKRINGIIEIKERNFPSH